MNQKEDNLEEKESYTLNQKRNIIEKDFILYMNIDASEFQEKLECLVYRE